MNITRQWTVEEVAEIPPRLRARDFIMLDGEFAYVLRDPKSRKECLCYRGGLDSEVRRIHAVTQAGARPLFEVESSNGERFARWLGMGDGPRFRGIRELSSLNGLPYYVGQDLNRQQQCVVLGEDAQQQFPRVGKLNDLFGKTCFVAELTDQRHGVIVDGAIVRKHDSVTILSTAENILRYAAKDDPREIYVYSETDHRGPFEGVWHLTSKNRKPLFSYCLGGHYAVFGNIERHASTFVEHLDAVGSEPVFTIKFGGWHVYQDNARGKAYDRIRRFMVMNGETLHDAVKNEKAFVVLGGHHLDWYRQIFSLDAFMGAHLYTAQPRTDGSAFAKEEAVAVYDEIESPRFDGILCQELDRSTGLIRFGARRGNKLYRLTLRVR